MKNNRKNDFYNFEDMFDKIEEDYTDCLTEEDFYPPADERILKSHIRDIDGGDNFSDYCEYMFDLLEEEGYWD